MTVQGIPEPELRDIVTQRGCNFEQIIKDIPRISAEGVDLSLGGGHGLRGGGNTKYLDVAAVKKLLDEGKLTFY